MEKGEIKIGGYYLIYFHGDKNKAKCVYVDGNLRVLLKFFRHYDCLHDGDGGCETRNIPKYKEDRYYWASNKEIERKLTEKESKNLWLHDI
jgi:hypothetical protein